MSNLMPAWTAPRAVSRTSSQINEPAPLASEVEEARQRTLRISRRLTQGNRKSTIGLEYVATIELICIPHSL